MIHWILLHWFLMFNNGVIGVERYCAFDREIKVWQCNYATVRECVSYNEFCAERED